MALGVALAVVVGGFLYHQLATPTISLPHLTAGYITVYDAKRDKLVYDKAGDSPRPPASLTKLMTLFVVYDEIAAGRLSYNDTFTVTPAQAHTPGSKYGMEPGEVFTVAQLIAGALLPSGCDCVQCLVLLVAEDESAFVARMNQKAKDLGLAGTHFANATGIDAADHYATARDLSILAASLVDTHPQILELSAQPTATVGTREFRNMHRLVGRDSRVLGLKTGTTLIGGYNLITYAQEGENVYIIVLLDSNNDKTRFSETQTVVNALLGEDDHG